MEHSRKLNIERKITVKGDNEMNVLFVMGMVERLAKPSLQFVGELAKEYNVEVIEE